MSTEEIPKKAVRALRTRIQVVRDHLEPLMARPLNETYSKLSMTEKYELQVLLSYTLNTLYYIYLRGNGSDPQKHVVLKELQRVQRYIQKLKEHQGKEQKPNMKVDKDAAGRFVKAALSENEDNKGKKRRTEELIVIESSSDDEKESKISTKKKARLVMDPFAGYDKK
ncbi:uncharacterized protein RHIMIDRAFT_234763 [Rhizopus microsporus ATCC 52813]|uniref:Exosome complex protein n=1 Tax=Rhizopus microsporus ATCC 52813 TaxID=1340429 RepID=A0A2G4T319_RHIZD|nr:uncharacterized protein RHIMIDRAFT_234763 [Rhizopus microsporus ATCC 52813]PHZ15413.1 hypothetical protein RHIMIDRAFT_234763 [Rhizopus microsporus ATCC 52813]